MHHYPELRAAYRAGPLTVWQNADAQMWAPAEARGEVPAGGPAAPPNQPSGAAGPPAGVTLLADAGDQGLSTQTAGAVIIEEWQKARDACLRE